jgi:hypothetical protein
MSRVYSYFFLFLHFLAPGDQPANVSATLHAAGRCPHRFA